MDVENELLNFCVQGLLPNANESAVINILTNGQFDALPFDDISLGEDFLLPPTPNPEDIGLPPLRRKRQAEMGLFYTSNNYTLNVYT